MPSSVKKTVKDIHQATNVGELNKLASLDLPTDVRNAKASVYCKSADKVFLKARDHDLEGDEENAYVFYMRYFNIISVIKKTKQYADNKKYYNNLIGVARVKTSIERAETLQKSLEKRYGDLKGKKHAEELEKEEARRKEEEDKRNSKGKNASKTNGADSDSGVDSMDSDLDFLLNGNGISSSSDVYQRLKVDHNAILTPEASEGSNDALIDGLESLRSFSKPSTTDGAPGVTAQELYLLLEYDESNILILDCRPRTMFVANNINRSCCISIPAELLDQGVSVGSIERRIPEVTRKIWKRRVEKEFVIIMDESTKVADVTPECRVQRLKDCIYTYDSFSSLKQEPVFLDGGFHSWLWHYPSLALKSELPKVSSQSKVVTPIDLSALDYPELPDEKEVPLPEPQLPQPPQNGPQTSSLHYPVLPGQEGKNVQDPSSDGQVGIQQTNLNQQPSAVSFQPGVVPGLNHGQHPSMVPHAPVPQTPVRPDQGQPNIGGPQLPRMVPSVSSLPLPKPLNLPSSPTGVATVVPSSTATSHPPMSQHSSVPSMTTQYGAPGLQPPVVTPSQPGVPMPNLAGVPSSVTSAPQPQPLRLPPSQTGAPLSQHSNAPFPRSGAPFSQPSNTPSPQASVPSSQRLHAPASQPSVPFSQPSGAMPSQAGITSPGHPSIPSSQTGFPPFGTSSSPSSQPSVPSSQPPSATSSQSGTVPNSSPYPGQKLPNPGPTTMSPSHTLPGSQAPNVTSVSSLAHQQPSVASVPPTSIPPPSSLAAPSAVSSEGSVHSKDSVASGVAAPSVARQQHAQKEHQVPGVTQLPSNVGIVHGQTPVRPSQTAPMSGSQVPPSATKVPPHGSAQGSVPHPAQGDASSAKQVQKPGLSQSDVGRTALQPGSEPRKPVVQRPQNPSQQSSSSKSSGYSTTPGLPQGWERAVNPTNKKVYYKDHNTQSTHWELPKMPDSTPKAVTPQPTGQNQQHPQTRRDMFTEKPTLRRSLSSPNLAKLGDQGSVPRTPVIDRLSKPDPKQSAPARPAFNRSAKPLSAHQLDNLNPSHGGIGQGLTGLRNLGNTCYMNSVLQCLSSVAPLAAYFMSGAYREDINKSNRDGTKGELAEQFSILIRVVHSGQFKCVSPGDFKRTVGKFKKQFSGYDQQDSQELLAFLMDGLQEDLNKVKQKPYLRAPGDDLDPETAAKIAWENHKKRSESVMVEMFDGLFMSTVRCMVCQKESYTFETFSNLTLPLPPHRNHCSLQECLTLFTRTEKMSGDDKWFCPKCQQRREASKQIQIWRLPAILIVHLKRFQYDGMWRQKLQTGVSFPMTQLDMSSYEVGPKSRTPYNLHAVSNHYGTMHGGHYTAFCRSVYDKRWYKFDDQFVTEMSPKEVVTSAGYLLFYTSFDFQPPKYFIKAQ